MPANPIPTYEQLLQSLNEASAHPSDTCWDIYRYLNANYKTIGMAEARILLVAYIRIPHDVPSLIHSCMLSVAIKISTVYPEFRFDGFLQAWGYPEALRPEDKLPQTGKDGRTYQALSEKVEKELAICTAPRITGYVDYYDAARQFYHVYDAQSRHFVADHPIIRPNVGDFVSFTPIIPTGSNFKTALIRGVMDKKEGAASFGLIPADIVHINKEKEYFSYKLTATPPSTPEGTYTMEGYGNLSLLPQGKRAKDRVMLLLFLKRGKDKQKRNYVADVLDG